MLAKYGKKDAIQYGAIALVVFLCLIFSSFAFKLDISIICRFIFGNVASIFLPGFALFLLFDFGKTFTKISRICLIYALGYASLVVQFFVSETTDRAISFGAVTCFVALLSVAYIVYHGKNKMKSTRPSVCANDSLDEWIGIIAFTLFLGLSVFAYSANYLSPEVSGVFSADKDMIYWGNNTASLKIAFPADYLFFSGTPLNYHYFSNIPIAFFSDVYDIDIFTLSFPLYSLTKAFIMVGAALILLEAIDVHKGLKIAGLIAFLFMTGVEDTSIVSLVHHTLLAPFGCDIGIAYGLLTISMFTLQWSAKCFDWRIAVITFLLWFMCVGSKGPVAIVVMVIPGVLCVCALFRRKYAFAFGYGIPVLLVFYFVSKYCLGLQNVLGEDEATIWRLSLYDLNDIATLPPGSDGLWRRVASVVQGNLPLVVLAKLVAMSPAVFFGSIISIVVAIMLVRKHNISARNLILYIALSTASVMGVILWLVVDAGGKSEMYFAMTAKYTECVAIIFIFNLYSSNSGCISGAQKAVKWIATVLLIILVALGVWRYMCFAYHGVGAFLNAESGISQLNKTSEPSSATYGIDRLTYEGLAWLRDNSDSDEIVLSDKAVIGKDPAFYYYGLFTERQQYIEGTNILSQSEPMRKEIEDRTNLATRAYKNDVSALAELRLKGVDYIISTKDITPQFDGESCRLNLAFENDAIAIYRL